MENQELQTIEAIENDPIYRYLSVPHALLRDESISPQCRWLIMYLLSNKEGWKVKVAQVVNHLKPHLGRKRVYDMFKEAIEAGYMKREDVIITNLRRGVKYIIASTPIFKKSFRHSNFGNAETRLTADRHDKEIPSVKNNHIEEQQQAAPAAAVYSCLEKEQRLRKEAKWYMTFEESKVEEAIKQAKSMEAAGKIKKSFAATVKWILTMEPKLNEVVDTQENKKIAEDYESRSYSVNFTLEALSKYAIISPKVGQSVPIVVNYDKPSFKEILLEAMKKCKFGNMR